MQRRLSLQRARAAAPAASSTPTTHTATSSPAAASRALQAERVAGQDCIFMTFYDFFLILILAKRFGHPGKKRLSNLQQRCARTRRAPGGRSTPIRLLVTLGRSRRDGGRPVGGAVSAGAKGVCIPRLSAAAAHVLAFTQQRRRGAASAVLREE